MIDFVYKLVPQRIDNMPRSAPSLIAGVSVGALYGWSAYQMQYGDPNAGLQGALGELL